MLKHGFRPLFAALMLFPAAAFGIDYGYVDAAVGSRDAPGTDFSGFGFRSSMPLTPQFYATVEAFSLDGGNGTDIDRTDLGVGAGYHMPLNRQMDLFAEIGFLSVDTDAGDEDGLRLEAGLRADVFRQLELRGSLEFMDLFDDEIVLHLGAEYDMNTRWSGFLEFSEGDWFDGYLLGARYDF